MELNGTKNANGEDGHRHAQARQTGDGTAHMTNQMQSHSPENNTFSM